jgi:hypothetical protein
MAAVAGISSPSSMKKKFTVSAGSAGGGASLGVHSARIAGNGRIAAGRLARCRSIVLPRASPRSSESFTREAATFVRCPLVVLLRKTVEAIRADS